MTGRFRFLIILLIFSLNGFAFSSGQPEKSGNDSPPVKVFEDGPDGTTDLSSSGKPSGSIVLKDSKGREIILSAYPEKVVSLGPNLTETVYALNRGDLLIGRTDFCNFPPAALSVPSVGTLMEPNIETIINMEPDLVLASTHVSEETVQTLEKMGIPVALLYGPEDFSGLGDVILGCGVLLNAESRAEALMTDVMERKDRVLLSVQGRDNRPAVYYALGFGDGGDWTAGAGTFIDSMIAMAGGENIATEEGWSFSKEILVERDPDIIFLGLGKKESFTSLSLYKDLRAVQEGRIYELDENMLVRQGPRLIDGLETLALLFEGIRE